MYYILKLQYLIAFYLPQVNVFVFISLLIKYFVLLFFIIDFFYLSFTLNLNILQE